jgi:hypothetical protein
VDSDCCLSCGVPETVAPELFATDLATHVCFVKRQPQSGFELYKMLMVIADADLQCIRYGGADPTIQRRLSELGEVVVCDEPPPPSGTSAVRTHVTFRPPVASTPLALAADLRRWLLAKNELPQFRDRPEYWYRVSGIIELAAAAGLAFSWHRSTLHRFWLGPGEPKTDRVLVWHSTTRGVAVSLMLHDWITDSVHGEAIRWYHQAAWDAGQATWQETPI